MDDSDDANRVFNVQYHIENLTDEPVRFFLNTSNIVPSTGGSSTMYPFYQLYEENTFQEIGNVFFWFEQKLYKLDNINLDSLRMAINQRKINVIVEMAPYEVKKFTMDFHWDRNRYYQNHDMEYYLEEKAEHFLEITIVLQKYLYHQEIPEVLFKEIIADNHFIEGIFTSNKKLIDFRKRQEK